MVTGRRFGFFMEPGLGFGYYGNRPFSTVKSTLPKETFYTTFRFNFGFHIPIKQSAYIEVGPYLYLHDPSDITTAGIKLDVGFNVFRPVKK